MEQKNKIAYIILLLASLLIAVIGGTYAFFTAGMSSGETQATLKVGAGQLKIKFANTNSVQIAENVQPTPAKTECTKKTGAYYCNQSEYDPVGTKTFTVTGTNTTDASKNMKMPYNIKLIIPQNQFSSGALKYTLIGSKEANDNGKVVNIDTWKDIPTGSNTTGIILGSGYFMPGENVVHTYTLNIYFPDNHIVQDADKNKIFGGLIEITTDEIKDSVPKGWDSASKDTLLGAIKRDNVISEPLSVPGVEGSAYTLDDAPIETMNIPETYQSYYFTYGTGWEANGVRFDLVSGNVTTDTYINSYSNLVGKYLPRGSIKDFSSNTSDEIKNTTNLKILYYILDATSSSLTYKKLTSNKNVNEAIFSSTEDDYGTSYYFRGAVDNNYVEYANMCWRIVRITGDGSIKLVLYNYNGLTSDNAVPTSMVPCSEIGVNFGYARYEGDTTATYFNSEGNDNAYIGFMYGTVGANSYAEAHANTNPSTILINLNKWYTNVLSKQSNFDDSQLADTIWCNDKSVVTDTAFNPINLTLGENYGYGININYYNTMKRLVEPLLDSSRIYVAGGSGPSLICPNDNNGGKLSKFTVSDTEYGNGALSGYAKMGLLTADEIAFAGGAFLIQDTNYYLSQNATSNWWWTLSPSSFQRNLISMMSGYMSGGLIISNFISEYFSFRPSLSLVSSTKATGTGTATDPYKIVS